MTINDHDHYYQFFSDRASNQLGQSAPEAQQDDIEPRTDLRSELESLFYEIHLLEKTDQSRSQDLTKLKDILLHCKDEFESELLKYWMPTVYRLSKENYCPVDMVRTAMQDLMSELRGETSRDNQPANQDTDNNTVTNQTRSSQAERKRSLRSSIGTSLVPRDQNEIPSRYISNQLTDFKLNYDQDLVELHRRLEQWDEDHRDELTDDLTDDELRRLLLVETWNQFHRIDNLSLTLAIHPRYFQFWKKFNDALLHNDPVDGLKRIEKIYIGIMAASASKSTYLYFLLVNEFKHDDDFENQNMNYAEWIEEGYNKIPQKFKDLCELNEMMVTSPWLIDSEIISKFTVNAQAVNSWLECELVQAIVILAWIHSNAAFCYGIGINPEIDAKKGRQLKNVPSQLVMMDEIEIEEEEEDAEGSTICEVIARMQRINRERTESETRNDLNKEEENAKSRKAYLKLREDLSRDISDTESDSDDDREIYQDLMKHLSKGSNSLNHFLNNNAPYTNSLNEETELRLQDFDWKSKNTENALNILTDQLRKINNHDLNQILDDKFTLIQKLTYNKIGKKKAVDTAIFRYGVWNFAHCKLGIMSSDCNYEHLEQLLDEEWRRYINKIVMTPISVTKQDYNSFCRGLDHDEKVHVNLLCMEARFQAELLYTMRAVSRSTCRHY